jgi:hypothetical protein
MKINFRSLALGLLMLGTIVPYSAIAQTRLGLHVTQEELNIWKQRAQSGPYKTAGDVSANSPGDWDRIVTNKNTFMSNPSAGRWSGQVSAQCWNISPPSPGDEVNLMQAAFYAMVASDSTVATAVRTELLAQTAVTGTNFADKVRWCSIPGGEDGAIHDYASWLIRLLHTYDYVKSSFSASQQTTMNTWFLNAANYMDTLSRDLILSRFPNRDSDDYATFGGGWDSANLAGGNTVIYYGGPTRGNWHEGWNNRAALLVTFSGLVGIMQNNSTLIAHAKRWFKEYITYNVFFTDGKDCHGGDYYRWSDGAPNRGWQYTVDLNTSMAVLADAFARTGDFELINYSTSSGLKGTSGGPKSLRCLITTDLKYVVPDITHYGTNNSANQNLTWRIDTQDPVAPLNAFRDIVAAITNSFFNDANNKTIYMRTKSGAPAYPNSLLPFDERGEGPRALHSGILFMFGQMEGKISPYPTRGSQLPSINLTAAPDTIASGQSSMLTWSTSNATSCTGSGGWTGTIATSGTQTVTPAQSTTYTLSCTGTAGAASQSTTVTVSTPPSPNPPNAPTNLNLSLSP